MQIGNDTMSCLFLTFSSARGGISKTCREILAVLWGLAGLAKNWSCKWAMSCSFQNFCEASNKLKHVASSRNTCRKKLQCFTITTTPPKTNGWNPKSGGLGRCFSFSKLKNIRFQPFGSRAENKRAFSSFTCRCNCASVYWWNTKDGPGKTYKNPLCFGEGFSSFPTKKKWP